MDSLALPLSQDDESPPASPLPDSESELEPSSPRTEPPYWLGPSELRQLADLSVSGDARVSTLDALYVHLSVRRRSYFPGTDENSSCVPYVGSTFCTASTLQLTIGDKLAVSSNLGTTRLVSRIRGGLDGCTQRQKRYCWFLIVLFRSGFHPHSNALFVDIERRESWLFEPHGSDPTHPLHGDGFFHLYDAPQYFALFRDLMSKACPEGRFFSPADYQPGVFAQSVSGLCRAGEIADRFCVFWTLFFLVEATRSNPRSFVSRVKREQQDGALNEVASKALRYMSHNIDVVMSMA